MFKLLLVILFLRFCFVKSFLPWNLCSNESEGSWSKHNSSYFIKAWIKSFHILEEKCPYRPLKVIELTEDGGKQVIELVLRIKDLTGWKKASVFNKEQFHSGFYHFVSMNENGILMGKS